MTKRLSKQDWISQAFNHLKQHGFNTLSAVSLAESLKVSRGSFYWHFKSFPQFRDSVLEAWIEVTTDSVIKELENEYDPKAKLLKLTTEAMSYSYDLDRAIRAWANCDSEVVKKCRDVDEKRTNYITQLLIEIGVAKSEAPARAHFLYWSSLGRTLSENNISAHTDLESIRRIIQLLCSNT